MEKKIGIIGNGFVGEALAFAFSSKFETRVYDINESKSLNTLKQVHECEIIFVCVPTPMFSDGTQDLSYINNVFNIEYLNDKLIQCHGGHINYSSNLGLKNGVSIKNIFGDLALESYQI